MRLPVYEVSARGVRPAPLTSAQLARFKAWGYRITYDDCNQAIECRPMGGGFGPVQVFAY